jgi:hypothetical protein
VCFHWQPEVPVPVAVILPSGLQVVPPMLAEGLMATMLSDDTLILTAPRSTGTAEPWFCIRYQVCLKFN